MNLACQCTQSGHTLMDYMWLILKKREGGIGGVRLYIKNNEFNLNSCTFTWAHVQSCTCALSWGEGHVYSCNARLERSWDSDLMPVVIGSRYSTDNASDVTWHTYTISISDIEHCNASIVTLFVHVKLGLSLDAYA